MSTYASRILGHLRSWLSHARLRRASEAGYAAVMVAIVVPTVGIGCAAVAVDTGTWYVQMQMAQKAADAAALAGVPFLPQDLPNAKARALEVAARNGFDNTGNNTVTVGLGDKPTQLKVTISATIKNTFGSALGINTATIRQSGTADYQGPAPMGSPCNTFGNEPNAGNRGLVTPTGTAHASSPPASCVNRIPQFWALVEGPDTDKEQGDRYQTTSCSGGTAVDGCDSSKRNTEYDPFGYVFVVKVAPAAVNTQVKLQLFDPMYVNTGNQCQMLPAASSFPVGTTAQQNTNVNSWVTNKDAVNRYTKDGSYNGESFSQYCPGDNNPESQTNAMATSYVLRQQTDSQNPKVAEVQSDTSGKPCIKQYGTYNANGSNLSANAFKTGSGYLGDDIVSQFHNWADFCTFTPTRSGDYYLQVRTNVSMGGSGNSYVTTGNKAAAAVEGNTSTGNGENAFAIRAVTSSGNENNVSVSGYNHMPIFMNATGATATFNLIRVLPGAAGQKISFSFFDAGDATSNGSVQVLPPTDATGTSAGQSYATNCTAYGGRAGGSQSNPTSYPNCNPPFSKSTNNAKSETITIPIPTDYSCDYAKFTGCWYRVQVTFPGGSTVTDVTTWDATVIGDPVRLIE